MTHPPKNHVHGFTLTELMLVIVIIGILSTVAIPSYKKYVQDAKLADGYMILGNLTKMEIIYYESYSRFFFGGADTDTPMTEMVNGRRVILNDHHWALCSYEYDEIAGFGYTTDYTKMGTLGLASQQLSFVPQLQYGEINPSLGVINDRNVAIIFVGIDTGGTGPACEPNTEVANKLPTDYGVSADSPDWFTIALVGNFSIASNYCVMMVQTGEAFEGTKINPVILHK